MGDRSDISWTSATWNPTVGCMKVSAGCESCYAINTAYRLDHAFGQPAYAGLTRKLPNGSLNWTGTVRTLPERLALPLSWRKPRLIFVDSMSDLFHEDVSDEFIAAVFGVMLSTPKHSYQVLTKRPKRMLDWFRWISGQPEWRTKWVERVAEAERMCGEIVGSRGAGRTVAERAAVYGYAARMVDQRKLAFYATQPWPLPNVWLGVSVEDQRAADERIPLLLRTPAAVRFLSCEPLIGPVDVRNWLHYPPCPQHPGEIAAGWGHLPCDCRPYQTKRGDGIQWLIAGGESGPKFRPMNTDWARSLRDQCQVAGIPFFFKQVGGRTHAEGGCLLDGREYKEFPEPAREAVLA